MKFISQLTVFAIFFISLTTSFIFAAENPPPTDSQDNIGISAELSKIKWDKDIIRSWDASGDVEIEYTQGEKRFTCTASKALFTREGDKKPFKDKIQISGNVSGNLNGLKISASEIFLESDGTNFHLTAEKGVEIQGDGYSLKTDKLILDASNGDGELPAGGDFEFDIEGKTGQAQEKSQKTADANIFSQCLRVDISGGIMHAPYIQIHYTENEKREFFPESVSLPNGAELKPRVQTGDSDSIMKVNRAIYDFKASRLEAHDGITLKNAPCEIDTENLVLDWLNHKILLEGNVSLKRDYVEFSTGKIEVAWDNEGRISLDASEKPRMSIVVPQESTNAIIPK
jgi:hypothetical protein